MQAQQAGGSVADFMTENKKDRPILNIQFDTLNQSKFICKWRNILFHHILNITIQISLL